jgi:hypothetical protein
MRPFIAIVEDMNSTFLMWHGSRRWDGSPEIRAPRAGRYEAGPGIYLSTNYMTARRYAKGGGATMLATVDQNLALAERTLIPLATALEFCKTAPRMRHKREIAADVRANADRHHSDAIAANILINLVVNYEAGSGDAGLALARFLRDQGVDGSLEPQNNEDWLVIINPKVIRSMKRVPANEVPSDLYHLPLIRDLFQFPPASAY